MTITYQSSHIKPGSDADLLRQMIAAQAAQPEGFVVTQHSGHYTQSNVFEACRWLVAKGFIFKARRNNNDIKFFREQAARAAAMEEAAKDSLPLQLFMDAVIGEFPEHGDLDGITLQEIAEACGLLKEGTAVVPCGENCACAESLDDGRTTNCYQAQPVMRRARIASARHDAAIRAAKESK